MRILIGASGSIAVNLIPKLAERLVEDGHRPAFLFTPSASKLYGAGIGSSNYDEVKHYKEKGDVFHVTLRKGYDLLLMAPLSANTLGKISNGLCDNLLTNVVRCWDYSKPMLLAPAMNTYMWSNPITHRQLEVMRNLGAEVINPIRKTLACGDTGLGAMAHINTIAGAVKAYESFPRKS